MNLKQRIVGLLVLVIFLAFLTYVCFSNVISDFEMKTILQHQQMMKNFSASRKDDEYQRYEVVFSQMKTEVHRARKKFLLWKEILHLNKKRKNINIDVMNQGDQKKCRDLTLLFMVSSTLSHLSRRNIIRSTWLNHSHWREYEQRRKVSFEMIFIVGHSDNKTLMREVRKESKKNGDLLILDLDESFYSLSYKVMIGFQWVTENCQGYKFLLKGDDDIFVNIHALMSMLHEPTTPKNNLYVGNSMVVAEVVRNGRYGVSREEYQRDNYPRYNSGGGFVLSSDVVKNMIPHFDWITPLKIDDAYMGGLILKAGVDCINDKRFHMYDEGCVFRKDTIVSHTNDKIVLEPKCVRKLNSEALKSGLKYLDRHMN